MPNPLFDLIKSAAKAATGTTVGKVTTTAFVMTVAGVGAVKVYQNSKTGDIVGAERVETTVAKNDAQGDVRLKMEGLKGRAEGCGSGEGESRSGSESRGRSAEGGRSGEA